MRPITALALGTDGYLYGTTITEGIGGYGTVFRVPTNGSGFITLHSFTDAGTDGALPEGALVQGRGADSTNFYGTTSYGGTNGYGTVFQVNTNGTTFTTLHQFSGTDGFDPRAGLVWGYDGYSSIWDDRCWRIARSDGTVFRTSSNSNFSTVYVFQNGLDGGSPDDSDLPGKGLVGNIYDSYVYGTAITGGSNGHGAIYKLDPAMYAWSISNGTITSASNTTNITWTAGSVGICSICVTISENNVCSTNICANVVVSDLDQRHFH